MNAEFVAAIDLGSNSFHMIVARIVNEQMQVMDRLREMVQLAAGLDDRNQLSEEAQQRALDCLARFGQRLRNIPPQQLRIVGTNTLRQARNSAEFLTRAEAVLGHNVEIISGQEEARLIYLGVAHNVADAPGRRLVVDIGGGSTELIIGEKFDPVHLVSLKMGCVSMSRACFDDGKIIEARFREAELRVQLRLEPVREDYVEQGWEIVTGASGSIKAIQDVVMQEGWSRKGITLDSLRRLRTALVDIGDISGLTVRWQLEPARAKVFAGGFVILHGLCEAFNIERIEVSEGALREGVIYDLLGRIRHEDVRDRTITTVIERYGLDQAQSERVMETALELLHQVAEPWGLDNEDYARVLEWAARLHEIGMLLTYNKYNKHGAYILQYADLPGFSQDDQRWLAALVRRHRRSFPKDAFAQLPRDIAPQTQRLCVLLRLAVVLNRARNRQPPPTPTLRIDGQRLKLQFPVGWLSEHPLTQADLAGEAHFLREADFRLKFK